MYQHQQMSSAETSWHPLPSMNVLSQYLHAQYFESYITTSKSVTIVRMNSRSSMVHVHAQTRHLRNNQSTIGWDNLGLERVQCRRIVWHKRNQDSRYCVKTLEITKVYTRIVYDII